MYTELMLSQKTRVAVRKGQWSSSKRLRKKHISATAFAIPLYYASALDLETVCCRFEDQEIKLSPRYTA